MDARTALALVLTVVLVVANGFFVAAEYAFVRVRKTQLDEIGQQGSARARLASRVLDRLDQYISASQLGVTLCSLAIGWLGEPAVAALLEPIFDWLPDPLLNVISLALAFGVITYVHIVVGELAPKYLSIQRAVPLALWCAYPLHLFYRLMYPFIALVNGSANAILRWVGIRSTDELDVHSEEELKMLVAVSTKKGVLQERERLIAGLVTLEDVIEQLVGEVQDEFDREAPAFKEEGPGTYVVDGLTALDALRERLQLLLVDEPYDTVGGLVFGRLGRLAAVGDTVEIEGYRFQVTGVDGRRVAQVRVMRARPPRRAA